LVFGADDDGLVVGVAKFWGGNSWFIVYVVDDGVVVVEEVAYCLAGSEGNH
jgi:hypothetical protein